MKFEKKEANRKRMIRTKGRKRTRLKDERTLREQSAKQREATVDWTKRARMRERGGRRGRERERRRVERCDEEEPNERVTT